jgi:hypothetical protein
VIFSATIVYLVEHDPVTLILKKGEEKSSMKGMLPSLWNSGNCREGEEKW